MYSRFNEEWKVMEKEKKSILRVWPKCGSVGETTLPINSESSPCLFWSLRLSPGIGRDLSLGFITCFRAKSENLASCAVSQIPLAWIIQYTKLQYFWSSPEPHHMHYIRDLLYYFVFFFFLVTLSVTQYQFKYQL